MPMNAVERFQGVDVARVGAEIADVLDNDAPNRLAAITLLMLLHKLSFEEAYTKVESAR